MTDNEKAATFIGWCEGQPCPHRNTIPDPRYGNGISHCWDCHCRIPLMGQKCEHIDPAPDMGKAENWVKALETRAAEISPMVDGARHWDRLLDAVYISLRAKNADAVISYLVRRYDEDHRSGE